LDPYNPTGSTAFVNFYSSKASRWQTDSRLCHINWALLDSDWEGEFCRVVELHDRVKAYVKNQGLGLEVPYRYGSNMRTYIPDFIVRVDDGQEDLLNLIVEIKGYRGEDAKEKKSTMDTYWIPGVNHLGTYGRWAFLELKDVYLIKSQFGKAVEEAINNIGK
jgi:type III restriction enzyme